MKVKRKFERRWNYIFMANCRIIDAPAAFHFPEKRRWPSNKRVPWGLTGFKEQALMVRTHYTIWEVESDQLRYAVLLPLPLSPSVLGEMGQMNMLQAWATSPFAISQVRPIFRPYTQFPISFYRLINFFLLILVGNLWIL